MDDLARYALLIESNQARGGKLSDNLKDPASRLALARSVFFEDSQAPDDWHRWEMSKLLTRLADARKEATGLHLALKQGLIENIEFDPWTLLGLVQLQARDANGGTPKSVENKLSEMTNKLMNRLRSR